MARCSENTKYDKIYYFKKSNRHRNELYFEWGELLRPMQFDFCFNKVPSIPRSNINIIYIYAMMNLWTDSIHSSISFDRQSSIEFCKICNNRSALLAVFVKEFLSNRSFHCVWYHFRCEGIRKICDALEGETVIISILFVIGINENI